MKKGRSSTIRRRIGGGAAFTTISSWKRSQNTLNFQLATELVRFSGKNGCYDPDEWLERYIGFMLTPGSHKDTYLEEYHRGFFTKYSQGKGARKMRHP